MTSCPSCGAPVPHSAVSNQLGAARCPACRALIDLDSARATRPQAPPPPRSLALPIPERWHVDATPGTLLVRWRWFTFMAVMLVPFTLFWNGILVGMAGGVTDNFTHPERLLFGILVPHVWVGVGLTYTCLTLFVNSTTVRVADGTLYVRHGPLPWRGTRTIPTLDVQQLFVVEKRGNRGGVSYELCALLREGKRQALLTGLKDELEARFLEVRLEQVMNIADQHVVGELKQH